MVRFGVANAVFVSTLFTSAHIESGSALSSSGAPPLLF